MTTIVMPKLSDSMEQGTIISWFRSSGDHVQVGDELLEIETDKSTAPYLAEVAGVLEILVPVGTTVAVGEPIASIGNATVTTPAKAALPAKAKAALVDSHSGNGQPGAGTDPRATPLARRMAAAHGITLAALQGTGPLGRITRADVLSAAGLPLPVRQSRQERPPLQAATPPPSTVAQAPSQVAGRLQPLSRMQQLIATRMAQSKATVPHFQVQTEANMDAAMALRQQLKAITREGEPVPSINDLIVKAAASALRNHPLANGTYRDGAFELHDQINVGVAVAADQALVVPTVFDADTKSLVQIAADTRRLANSVRDGSIAPHELEGGTFTVSNLGMFGMTAIAPVINAPQAAILGVGALRPTLARVDDEIVEKTLLTLTLSCDHRILYGADAARFLAEIRELLEAPLRLVL